MQRYAVIGYPVEHSMSPELYGRLFKKHGVDAEFVRRPVTLSEVCDIRSITSDLSGFAVTMPLKKAIIPSLDGMDETAKACGAVNIVERRGDLLIGHNTDGDGLFDAMIASGFDPAGKAAAILGRGGAALSAAHALTLRGADVTLLVRNSGTSEYKTAPLSAALSHFDVFINASPVGMANMPDFWELTFLDIMRPKLVFDMVYRRDGDTALVRGALERGIPAVGGLEMLRRQGLRAFKIWFGIDP